MEFGEVRHGQQTKRDAQGRQTTRLRGLSLLQVVLGAQEEKPAVRTVPFTKIPGFLVPIATSCVIRL
jgi:hypothetical protein